jgi:hypothetical protein
VIHTYEKLLFVLSENAVISNWGKKKLRRASMRTALQKPGMAEVLKRNKTLFGESTKRE